MRKKTVHLFMCAVLAAALGTFGTVAKAVPVSLSFDPFNFAGILNIDVDPSCFAGEDGTHNCLINYLSVDFFDIDGNHYLTGVPFSEMDPVQIIDGKFFAFEVSLTPPFFFQSGGSDFAFSAFDGFCDSPALNFYLPNANNVRVATFSCDNVVKDGNSGIYFVVPEPGTLALLGLGLVALAASRRRKPS